jgi:serine protease Do
MTDGLRQIYKIKDQIKGLVITGVYGSLQAAEKRLNAGDVIVAVAQEPIASPADLVLAVAVNGCNEL